MEDQIPLGTTSQVCWWAESIPTGQKLRRKPTADGPNHFLDSRAVGVGKGVVALAEFGPHPPEDDLLSESGKRCCSASLFAA